MANASKAKKPVKSAKKNVSKKSSGMERDWGWLFGLGLLFVFLGCLGLGMMVGLTLVSVLFLGVLFLVAGFAQLIDSFKAGPWKGHVWHAMVGACYLIAGALIIYDPFLASTFITALIAWILIIMGLSRIVMTLNIGRKKGWGLMLLAGLTSFLLGILILIQWPYSGLWIIGLFISIELIINGWTYMFIALNIKRR